MALIVVFLGKKTEKIEQNTQTLTIKGRKKRRKAIETKKTTPSQIDGRKGLHGNTIAIVSFLISITARHRQSGQRGILVEIIEVKLASFENKVVEAIDLAPKLMIETEHVENEAGVEIGKGTGTGE